MHNCFLFLTVITTSSRELLISSKLAHLLSSFPTFHFVGSVLSAWGYFTLLLLPVCLPFPTYCCFFWDRVSPGSHGWQKMQRYLCIASTSCVLGLKVCGTMSMSISVYSNSSARHSSHLSCPIKVRHPFLCVIRTSCLFSLLISLFLLIL